MQPFYVLNFAELQTLNHQKEEKKPKKTDRLHLRTSGWSKPLLTEAHRNAKYPSKTCG